ncbi:hypothetical protein XELAEV_18011837mg [Xenopus laevis]|uniref:Ubiquitin-like protease family profile domain-containing protein n=1 Tax=Xenopus laevis TaxID=8355 RepID=A0A974HY62_XENLA|nr:hypothetical protein XELAEV_18011837mg [Xenopus laevis]
MDKITGNIPKDDSKNQQPPKRKRKISFQSEIANKTPKLEPDEVKQNTKSSQQENNLNTDPCGPLNSHAEDKNEVHEEFWIPELHLTVSHKEMLLTPGRGLTRVFVDAAQTLLKKQFNAKGLQSVVKEQFIPVSGPSVQFHVDYKRAHVFLSCYRKDHVEIVDSWKYFPSEEPLKHIRRIYKKVVSRPLKTLKFAHADRQVDGSRNCVIYSIANAYEILSNGNVCCKYDHGKMREHLFKCLENGEITEFPKIPQDITENRE